MDEKNILNRIFKDLSRAVAPEPISNLSGTHRILKYRLRNHVLPGPRVREKPSIALTMVS